MKIEFSQFSQFEINDAIEYYNLQQENLGLKLKEDIKKYIENISKFPLMYPQIQDSIRRCLLHRFPYMIFYAIENETIVVLSFAHQNRKPFYWS